MSSEYNSRPLIPEVLVDGETVPELESGVTAVVLLDRTPFYAESGGQVGDTGSIRSAEAAFEVEDTIKLAGVFHGHIGTLQRGSLRPGDAVLARVDGARREAIVLHHSATHLMHAALKEVLGDHVEQRGSLVAPDHLRFDFTHPRAVTAEELTEIERLVNREIRVNPAADVRIMDFDDALETGATALFGEKYGDRVRVISLSNFSKELCGGTHTRQTGDIGLFKIVSESSIASGVRRIEALTGQGALEYVQKTSRMLEQAAHLVKEKPGALAPKIEKILNDLKALEKEIDHLKAEMASGAAELGGEAVQTINDTRALIQKVTVDNPAALRDLADRLKEKIKSGIVVLASVNGPKVFLIVGVSKDLTDRFHAGKLIKQIAATVGGSGGGRPDMAQAGGTQPEKLDQALKKAYEVIETT